MKNAFLHYYGNWSKKHSLENGKTPFSIVFKIGPKQRGQGSSKEPGDLGAERASSR